MFLHSQDQVKILKMNLIKSKTVDYCNEESLQMQSLSLQFKLDIIIVAIGQLENPENQLEIYLQKNL